MGWIGEAHCIQSIQTGARFTKYLTTILQSSYYNAKVTIDLGRTSYLQNIIRRTQGFFGTIHLQNS